jgi:integrase
VNAFRRGKKGNQSIYVPTRHGGLVQRSTGSNVPAIVRGMKRMVKELKDRSTASGNWSILDAIYAKKLRLRATYDYYVSNRLSELEARLSSADLSTHLDGWIAWVRANRRDDVRTADVYWQQVTTLIQPGVPFLSGELTKARVIAWLASRTAASSGTKRKYLYALKSFVGYLVDVGVLSSDPLAGLKAPKKNPARERWESAEVDERIVKNALPQYRAFFAFIKGTGCDVGSAQRAQVGDVNVFGGTVNLRGTKTDRRRVHQGIIEPWALPYVRQHLSERRKAGGALLFPGIGRNAPSKHHDYLCSVKLSIADYTLKDARHSVAVRMRLDGKSFEEIADQLGTSVFQAVSVYSKYRREPNIDTGTK